MDVSYIVDRDGRLLTENARYWLDRESGLVFRAQPELSNRADLKRKVESPNSLFVVRITNFAGEEKEPKIKKLVPKRRCKSQGKFGTDCTTKYVYE